MTPESAIYTAFDDATVWDSAQPEKNLMRAILRAAMEDIKKPGDAQRDAIRFFLSTDKEYLFSFLCICESLALCPIRLRREIGFREEVNQPVEDRIAA